MEERGMGRERHRKRESWRDGWEDGDSEILYMQGNLERPRETEKQKDSKR